jgi:hypothetical protein
LLFLYHVGVYFYLADGKYGRQLMQNGVPVYPQTPQKESYNLRRQTSFSRLNIQPFFRCSAVDDSLFE